MSHNTAELQPNGQRPSTAKPPPPRLPAGLTVTVSIDRTRITAGSTAESAGFPSVKGLLPTTSAGVYTATYTLTVAAMQ